MSRRIEQYIKMEQYMMLYTGLLQIKWHAISYLGLGTLTPLCNARTLLTGSGIERWVLAKCDLHLLSITDNCKLGKFWRKNRPTKCTN